MKSKNKFFSLISLFFLFVLPASTDYKLRDFGFGNGGTSDSSSANYRMSGIAGETSGDKMSGPNYGIGPGLVFVNQANVPLAPNLDNPNNYYNKLRLILNPSDNSSDAKFAIAISEDNFISTKYVQNDNTIGDSLGSEDYQTYADWGGVSGIYIIGLKPNTAYGVKAKAIQGDFTETGFGPVSSAATVNPTLSFDIDVSLNDTETNPPFAIDLGSLYANTIIDSSQKIWVDFDTNGEAGGKIYLLGQNAGLLSAVVGYKIDSVTGNLNGFSQGFGVQGSSISQSGGGPFSLAMLYNQVGDVVGIVDQNNREIFSSSLPISGGRGSFILKAKSSSITPSANDYSENLTLIACGNF